MFALFNNHVKMLTVSSSELMSRSQATFWWACSHLSLMVALRHRPAFQEGFLCERVCVCVSEREREYWCSRCCLFVTYLEPPPSNPLPMLADQRRTETRTLTGTLQTDPSRVVLD